MRSIPFLFLLEESPAQQTIGRRSASPEMLVKSALWENFSLIARLPAGMFALEQMMNMYSTYEYKAALDKALSERDFAVLTHEIVRVNMQAPAIAASVFFDLDTRRYQEEPPRAALNIFPVSNDQSIAIFSFTDTDATPVGEYLHGILASNADYQKYLISRLLLLQTASWSRPSLFETWPQAKRNAIRDFVLTSDDCAERDMHALTCSPDRNRDLLTCGDRMGKCRTPPCSLVLESDGLDPATEKGVALFQPVESGVQLRDNRLRLIGDYDQFDIDLFVQHSNTSSLQSYARPTPHAGTQVTGKPEANPLIV